MRSVWPRPSIEGSFSGFGEAAGMPISHGKSPRQPAHNGFIVVPVNIAQTALNWSSRSSYKGGVEAGHTRSSAWRHFTSPSSYWLATNAKNSNSCIRLLFMYTITACKWNDLSPFVVSTCVPHPSAWKITASCKQRQLTKQWYPVHRGGLSSTQMYFRKPVVGP